MMIRCGAGGELDAFVLYVLCPVLSGTHRVEGTTRSRYTSNNKQLIALENRHTGLWIVGVVSTSHAVRKIGGTVVCGQEMRCRQGMAGLAICRPRWVRVHWKKSN